MDNRLSLNFILSFCREQVPGHGEDSYCHAFCDTAGMIAVFDGCGGAGAQTHSCYSGHSEAFMASRLCAGAVYDSFCGSFPTDMPTQTFVQEKLARNLKQVLESFAPEQGEGAFQIRGSLVRTLPTTAAIALVRPGAGGRLNLSAVWAGDSRVYLLDQNGLAQLTVDDTTVPDPMENLYEDGVLRNVLCADRPVRLRCAHYSVKPPFMVFTATDGCFGYVPTPMDFESMILDTLMKSSSPAQWEAALVRAIQAVAGDDYTLCLAAYGYDSFQALRSTLVHQHSQLREHYCNPLAGTRDRQLDRQLWEQYAPNYCRYLKDGT